MTTIPSIEPATCSPAAGAPHVDAAASLPPIGPRACASEPLRSLPGAPRACASESLRSLHAAALPFAQLLADNAILQTVLESIVAAPLSPTPLPERSVEASAPPTVIESPTPPALATPSALPAPSASSMPSTLAAPFVPSAPPTLAVPSAPPALVGGDVLGAPRPGVEVPPAESSSVVSPVVSTRPDVAVEDGSSVAARRGRRALPSEGTVQGVAPSVPSTPRVPSTTSAPPVPPASVPSAPPTLVGGDVLGAPRNRRPSCRPAFPCARMRLWWTNPPSRRSRRAEDVAPYHRKGPCRKPRRPRRPHRLRRPRRLPRPRRPPCLSRLPSRRSPRPLLRPPPPPSRPSRPSSPRSRRRRRGPLNRPRCSSRPRGPLRTRCLSRRGCCVAKGRFASSCGRTYWTGRRSTSWLRDGS